MRQTELSVDKELLQVALVTFSAVSLATLDFLKNDFPSTDVLRVSKDIVVYMIILVQVLPALALLAADRLIAARYGSGRRLRIFRSLLFAVALLLIARQLQLYWGTGKEFTDSVRSASLALLVFADIALVAAIVALAIWVYRGLHLFFYYMSPVAIAMTAIIPFQVPTGGDLPEAYAQEVVTATQSESQPAVFILVFDEMGYDVLLKDGELDAESFPNIAALAEDGVWFTNATTNDFWSLDVLPNIIDPVKSLSEEFNVRLYSEFFRVEELYFDDCGQVMTCRGVGYLTRNNQLRLAANLALRSSYQATPKPLEKAMSRPMGWFLDRLGWPYPTEDGGGLHTFSKRQFDVFLDDVQAPDSLGRIHLLHLLLPHAPFVFDGDGSAVNTGAPVWEPETFPQRYREQVMFVDRLVGRLISRLKSEGIYERSVIAITGDHGPRSFIPSSDTPPNRDIPHVPLVIHAPGLDSRVTDVDYQHMDFGATLTDILGLPRPIGVGVSALSEQRPQRQKVFRVSDLTFIYSPEDGGWQVSRTAFSRTD